MKYKIEYTFPLNQSSIDLIDPSEDYWKTRGFDCLRNNEIILGKRGSSVGNLTSFNMSKLICDLHVDLSNVKAIKAELFVNGKYQDITEINLWDFKLELILFEYSIKGIEYPDFLTEYNKKRRFAAFKWSFSMMMKGRDFSNELKSKIEGLTKGNPPPLVEIQKGKRK
jgi:hypothetical protein